MITLRDYQVELKEGVRRAFASGMRCAVLCATTGAGKTVAFSSIIADAFAKGSPSLALVHSRRLVEQISETLTRFGVPHGFLMSGKPAPPPGCRVFVASRDTLIARAFTHRTMGLPPAKLVVCDEAHRCRSPGYQKILKHYRRQGAYFVWATATPVAADDGGLGRRRGDDPEGVYADVIVEGPKPSRLIAEGRVVRSRVFAPDRPDLTGIKKSGGEYVAAEADKRINRPKLVASALSSWKRHADGVPTLGVAQTREAARELCKTFNRADIPSEYVDGDTGDEEREAVYDRVISGETLVVWNVAVADEGLDVPAFGCLVHFAVTAKLRRWIQRCGRAKRPYEYAWGPKGAALVLDHGSAALTLGHPDQDVEWSLDNGLGSGSLPKDKGPKEKDEKAANFCPECMCVYSGCAVCPECGWAPRPKSSRPDWAPGSLEELGGEPAPAPAAGLRAKERYWLTCLHVGRAKGWPLKRCSGMFKSRYGDWPTSVEGLPFVPQDRGDWQRGVVEVFPELSIKVRK